MVAERAADPSLWRWAWSSPPPSLLLEQRAGLELAELLASPVYYGVGVPRGNGSPVLCVPGFLCSDDYLLPLRGWLRRMGYHAESSGISFCTGSLFDLMAQVVSRADAIVTRTGTRVTLIGHSLGGVLSRMAAVLRPDLIANVITLGSPLCRDIRGASHPLVGALARLLIRERGLAMSGEELLELEGQYFTAPLARHIGLTCVYTKQDAVVNWQACVDRDARTQAHEVRGTHSGLAWNASVYTLLAHVLDDASRSKAVPTKAKAVA
jgi:triacylglycerol lipase